MTDPGSGPRGPVTRIDHLHDSHQDLWPPPRHKYTMWGPKVINLGPGVAPEYH